MDLFYKLRDLTREVSVKIKAKTLELEDLRQLSRQMESVLFWQDSLNCSEELDLFNASRVLMEGLQAYPIRKGARRK